MQIVSNSLYDIGSSYTIQLNEKQVLVIDDDPIAKRIMESKKERIQKESQEQNRQNSKNDPASQILSEDEQRLVKDLVARDTEVKTHEAAHQGAGGGLTGAASYTYQQGPDGKMYAIGGEVSITIPSDSTPQERLQNARKLAAAALAAGTPSPQDFAVASTARDMEMRALQEIAKKTQERQLGEQTYKKASLDNQNKSDKEMLSNLDISA